MTLQDFVHSVETYAGEGIFWAGIEYRGGFATRPNGLTWRATVHGECFDGATPEDCLAMLRVKFGQTVNETEQELSKVEIGM